METYILKKSDNPKKKYAILMPKLGHTHNFGGKGYKDFTIYSKESPEIAEKKKKAYLSRHKKNEDWSKSGIHTPGFWSRWLLWNLPTLKQSIKDVEKRFNVKIKLGK